MIDRNELDRAVTGALDKLIAIDPELLHNDVNERTLTHRFAMYLEEIISGWEERWNVDCEYNRDASKGIPYYSKRLNLHDMQQAPLPIEDDEATTVFPDVIIHKRGIPGENDGNLLVMEIKKSSSSEERIKFDKTKKLPSYIKQLHYKYALFILLETKGKASYKIEWIK